MKAIQSKLTKIAPTLVLCAWTSLIPHSSGAAGVTPATQSELMAAQIQVTHDTLAQVLAKMKNDPNKGGEFSNPDFVAKVNEFNAAIEPAMQKFEAKLKDSILRPAGFYIQQLKAIENSSMYDQDQKNILLKVQIANVKTVFADLSRIYADAIYELYTLGLPQADVALKTPINCYKAREDSFKGDFLLQSEALGLHSQQTEGFAYFNSTLWKKIPGSACEDYFSGVKLRFYDIYFPTLRNRLFLNLVRNGCYTSSCIALYSNHRTAYINLISYEIDKPIQFKIGGHTLEIDPLYLGKENLLKYLRLQAGDTLNLPFDISESEYRRISDATAKRVQKIEQLKALLQTPSESSRRYVWWNCPAEVRQVKADICALNPGGCLTELEFVEVDRTIMENRNLMNRQERFSCLRGN